MLEQSGASTLAVRPGHLHWLHSLGAHDVLDLVRVPGTRSPSWIVIPAEDNLFEELTVSDNILVPLAASPRAPGRLERRRIATAAMSTVGLREADFHRDARSLSGGQRRLLAIARGIALVDAQDALNARTDHGHARAVLVAELPFAGLHSSSRARVVEALLLLSQRSPVIVIDPELPDASIPHLAIQLADLTSVALSGGGVRGEA